MMVTPAPTASTSSVEAKGDKRDEAALTVFFSLVFPCVRSPLIEKQLCTTSIPRKLQDVDH